MSPREPGERELARLAERQHWYRVDTEPLAVVAEIAAALAVVAAA